MASRAFFSQLHAPCRQRLAMQARRFSAMRCPASAGFSLDATHRCGAGQRRQVAPQRLHVRCLASNRGSDGDKSWSEIASEAGILAKDLVKKLGNTVSKVAGAITPSEKKEERPQRRERERRDVFRPEDAFGGGLVGGLLGKAVGGMLRSAVGALGEQLREAQEQVMDVQERASRVIEGSSRLRERMGGSVQAMAPVSQSSMSSSINGRMSKTVTLIMPVVGADGRTAQAQVQYVEGGSGASGRELDISVRLPNGQVIDLDGGSAGAATQTIDVEWRSVDDK